jgi:hypothetical protein
LNLNSQTEIPKAFDRRKNQIRTEWELFGNTIGLGDRYTIAMNKNEPKPMKLDGNHVKNLLKDNTWEKGVAILDDNPNTTAVWKVRLV